MRRASRISAVGTVIITVSFLGAGCSSLPLSGSEDGHTTTDVMVVEVSVTSDAATIEHLRVAVEATAGSGGSYVACEIRIAGKVVDENRAGGEGAGVVFAKWLRVGPQ